MRLTVCLIPGHDHRYLAAALASLSHQTCAIGDYQVCVLGDRDAFGAIERSGGPAVSFVRPGSVLSCNAIGASENVLVLRSDVAIFPDALARHLADGAGPQGVRLARVRQTPGEIQDGFHQYAEWHTGRTSTVAGDWPRLRWFDGLLIHRDHWGHAGPALAEPRPSAVALLDLECRLRREGARIAPAGGWTGHLIAPTTLASWREEAEATGRHAWALYDAWPESVLATDLGLSTALLAAADEARASRHASAESESESDAAPAPLSILEWRHAIGTWHAGVRQGFASGLAQAGAPRDALPIADGHALVDLGDPQPRMQRLGLAVPVEGDSRLMAVDVDGRPGFRVLRSPSGGYHAYFIVQDAPRGRRAPLDIVVEYLDRGRAVWGLDYDSTDRSVVTPPEPAGAFKRAEGQVAQEDSAIWKSARFTLPDWRFHRQCHGADIRLIGLEHQDDGIVVGKVTVELPFVGGSAPRRLGGDLHAPVQAPDAADPAVSIIVPTHDALPFTRQCLHAVTRTVREPYELIVVDNASSDDTRNYLTACRGVRLLRRDSNDSFAAACNAGARLARSPILVFLNNDTVALPGWLTALIWPLAHAAAGVTGARLLFPDWSIQHAGIEWTRGHPRHAYVHRPADSVDADEPRRVFGVTGACLAIHRSTFWDVAGFDERFRFGYEDSRSLHQSARARAPDRLLSPEHAPPLPGRQRARSRTRRDQPRPLRAPLVRAGGAVGAVLSAPR